VRRGLVLICLLPLQVLSSCGPPEVDWGTVRDCDADELILIDHAISEAIYAAPFVEALVVEAYGDSATYSASLDRLVTVRSHGRIYCAEQAEGEQGAAGQAHRERDAILLNVGSEVWLDSAAAWEQGAVYGSWSLEQIEDRALDADDEIYLDLRTQARAYLMGPALLGGILTHEAAHLETPGCCHHTREDGAKRLARGGDFVDDVDYWTIQGVYWRRWQPERQWLDRLYRSAR